MDLSHNLLSGNLTAFFSLSSLPSLLHLDLSSNTLSQEIPPLHLFGSLTVVDLSNNSFIGSLPPSLCGLTSLELLYLHDNALTGLLDHQSLQQCGEKLVALVELGLYNNKFTGSLPAWILSLPNIRNLDLSFNGLSGTLPNGFLSTTLSSLSISHNRFTGPFPSWIGSLPLSNLDLSYNFFVGSLPQSWQNLTNIQFLDLSGNSLIDPKSLTPTVSVQWIFMLPYLSDLSLSAMQLQPAHLGDCPSQKPLMMPTSIQWLDLSYNNLTTKSLSCLFPMPYIDTSVLLLELNFSANPFAASLDNANIVNLLSGRVVRIDLSQCQLKGDLSQIFLEQLQLSRIWGLYMQGNSLSGEIPAQLCDCSNLTDLDLSHNLFSEVAPSKGPNRLNQLQALRLSDNKLTNSLSSLLSSMIFINGSYSMLRILDLSNNLLVGPIPADLLSHCGILWRLKLNGNRLTSAIPNELLQNSSLPYLQTLSLGNNLLNGVIPPSFRSNLKVLVLLDLSHNYLAGDLQIALFENVSYPMKSLRVLLLGYNYFTGSVPISLGRLTPALQVLDISNNLLTGHVPPTLQNIAGFRIIPSETTNILTASGSTLFEDFTVQVKGNVANYSYVLKVMILLDVSGNNLSMPIPTGLGTLSGLISLNMSRNRLSGPIPSDLGKLTLLQSLDLSFNELEGSIPESFYSLHALGVFNVSYNRGLRGPIPDQPQFEDESSYFGDPYLCGQPTLQSCATQENTPQGVTEVGQESLITSFIRVWVSIPGFFLGLVVGFSGMLCLIELIRQHRRQCSPAALWHYCTSS